MTRDRNQDDIDVIYRVNCCNCGIHLGLTRAVFNYWTFHVDSPDGRGHIRCVSGYSVGGTGSPKILDVVGCVTYLCRTHLM